MSSSRALIALMIGVSGAILMISGIRDVHPAVTFQSLLQKGKLPPKSPQGGKGPSTGLTRTGKSPNPDAGPGESSTRLPRQFQLPTPGFNKPLG